MRTTIGEEARAVGALTRGSRLAVSWLRNLRRFIRNKPLGAVGGFIILGLLLTAATAPVLARYDPFDVSGADRLKPPGAKFWFGTDEKGRDLYSRAIYGAQLSVGVGFSAVFISISLASTIGLVSAYREGKTDLIMQRFVDGVMSIPTLVMLLAASVVLGRGAVTLVLLIGFLFGVRASRVVRSAALAVKQNDYVTAAKALGASDFRIILVHMLPNIFAPIMIIATVELGAVILTEAALSFLNLGIPPPAISWGQMLALTGLPYMQEAPWMVLVPGLAITMVVFGVNVLGDALRDVLDPRMRGAT